MTKRELSYYYVGQGIVTRIMCTESERKGPEYDLLMEWLNYWLTIAQKEHVNEHLGIDFDNPERPFPRFNTEPPDPEIPF